MDFSIKNTSKNISLLEIESILLQINRLIVTTNLKRCFETILNACLNILYIESARVKPMFIIAEMSDAKEEGMIIGRNPYIIAENLKALMEVLQEPGHIANNVTPKAYASIICCQLLLKFAALIETHSSLIEQ